MIEALSLADIAKVIWKRRWIVAVSFGVCVGIGLIALFVLPKSYVATATVFPVSSPASSSLSQLAGLASLAGLATPDMSGGSDPTQTVNALLSSRVLVEAVVRDLDLVGKLDPWGRGKAASNSERAFRSTVRILQSAISTSQARSTGVITISVTLFDPVLSQEIANHVLVVLDTLLSEKSLTTAKKRVLELNKQITAQKAKLEQYQQQMASFQKSTSMLDPKAQSGQAMDAFTSLIQQRINLEIQIASAEASYAPDNPKITVLKNQLDSLERQILLVKNQVGGDLPSLKSAPQDLIRYQNLAMDLEIASKIYGGLLASQEQARLSDDADQVYVEVLDPALEPTEGAPTVGIVVAISLAAGILVSFFWILLLEATALSRQKKETLSEVAP